MNNDYDVLISFCKLLLYDPYRNNFNKEKNLSKQMYPSLYLFQFCCLAQDGLCLHFSKQLSIYNYQVINVLELRGFFPAKYKALDPKTAGQFQRAISLKVIKTYTTQNAYNRRERLWERLYMGITGRGNVLRYLKALNNELQTWH